jgi:FAD/FMN-containing dehydrogenase
VPAIIDPDLLAGHATDWTGRWTGPVLGMVRPRTSAEVAAVLAAARSHRLPVQIQGGNTGLVGGSVPDRPSLLLSTVGLHWIHPVDPVERTVRAGAGVTLAQVAAHAAAAGLRVGIDLAARDSATLGGLVATNAGGMGVCAYGMTRDQVRGITAVLADGRIVRTVGRPRKDNAGPDLGGLLVGSEGTFGVITEVELALHPVPAASTVAMLAADDLATAVAMARAVQSGANPLLAAEVVDAQGVARAAAAAAATDPLPAGAAWMVLLEAADGATGEAFEAVGDSVIAMATAGSDRARLWAYRERQTELYAALPGPGPEKLDISLRLDRLDEGVAAIRELVAAVAPLPGGEELGRRPIGGRPRLGIFGHALDGNLHVQLLDAPPGTALRILEVVAGLGGGISAEHGIGRLKAAQLPLARSADEIAWMRQVAKTVDPDRLLNPGVLFTES